jgi:hypothetical protein
MQWFRIRSCIVGVKPVGDKRAGGQNRTQGKQWSQEGRFLFLGLCEMMHIISNAGLVVRRKVRLAVIAPPQGSFFARYGGNTPW